MWRWLSVMACAVLGGRLVAAEPAFVGANACAGCHPAQAEAQARSEHARALSRPADHALAEDFPTRQPLTRAPGFRYQVEQADGRLETEAAFADMARRTVIDWAFGAGDQAVTFVSRLDDQWYLEHHWSYYSTIGAYGPTPGHQNNEADDLGQALGVMYRTFSPRAEILRCFRCHSTGPLGLGAELAIEPAEPGIRCEACHGPGGDHVARVAAGELAELAIVNPGKLEPAEFLKACGQCHRPPDGDPGEIDYRDPWNIRHQPVYLVRSACFQQSGALTCIRCHDPHAPLLRNDSTHYDARCKSCHAAADSGCKAGRTAECDSCHMPKVEPQEGLQFTNHWIGVFPPGESFLPSGDSAPRRRF